MAAQTTSKSRARNFRTALRYGFIVAGVTATLTAGIYTSQKFQQFMLRDPRFFLPGPSDYGFESPNLELDGVKFASRAQILRLFEHDYGRSLYLFPMTDRRNALLNIRWVRDASIQRIWPNRIVVRIAERQHDALGAHRRRRRDFGSSAQGSVSAPGAGGNSAPRQSGPAGQARP